jgi:hypothetical protein
MLRVRNAYPGPGLLFILDPGIRIPHPANNNPSVVKKNRNSLCLTYRAQPEGRHKFGKLKVTVFNFMNTGTAGTTKKKVRVSKLKKI